MRQYRHLNVRMVWLVILLVGVLAFLGWGCANPSARPWLTQKVKPIFPWFLATNPLAGLVAYVVIGWNDLGMHCYDLDYSSYRCCRRITIFGRRSSSAVTRHRWSPPG